MIITKQDSVWIAHSHYEEKDILKRAGFIWSFKDKVWWTTDPLVVSKVAKYVAPDHLKEVQQLATEYQKSYQLSNARSIAKEFLGPNDSTKQYLPFQKAAIEFALLHPNTLIGDDPGTGKTIEAIGYINNKDNLEKILITCPSSALLWWKETLAGWLIKPLTVDIASTKYIPTTNIVLLSHDVLRRSINEYAFKRWDLVIVDEAHKFKNYKAKRSKALYSLNSDYNLYLTGSPIVNRPIELWPLLHRLDPKRWNNYFKYIKRYCNAHKDDWGHWVLTGASNLEELQKILRSTVMIRRLKSEVLPDLPPKFRQVIELPIEQAHRILAEEREEYEKQDQHLQALRQAVEKAKVSDKKEDYLEAVRALKIAVRVAFNQMSKVRHKTSLAKLPAVIDHIKDVLETKSKLVVYAHHHDIIQFIKQEFPNSVILTGNENYKQRAAAVEKFQTNTTCSIFIGSIQAAGISISLTAADQAIFAELDWSPGNITQAEDRLLRIGQHSNVLIQHLVLEGSLDAKMAKTLIEKQESINRALDKPEGDMILWPQ